MNIKEHKVEQTSEVNEPKMITKLAIGKPGGADFSDEKWEQIIEVSCRKCNKSINYKSNEQLSALVVSILNAASESDKSGIQAWEEEINPCEHTLTLQQVQNIKIAEKTMAKCIGNLEGLQTPVAILVRLKLDGLLNRAAKLFFDDGSESAEVLEQMGAVKIGTQELKDLQNLPAPSQMKI